MKSASNINDILAFLRRLEANNDRAWFKAHKDEYDALRKPWEDDIGRLIARVGEYDPGTQGLGVKDAVYRIYRDIRFRKDKSPYKNYFSAVIGRGGRHTLMSCNYVHFQPGQVLLCGGIWMPERPVLARLRSLIDAEQEEFLSIVNNPAIAARYRWECTSLKTVPRDYPKDHPMADYLKMKEYLLVMRPDAGYFDCDDWVERVANDLQPLQPLHDFLNYVFEQ